MVYRRLTYVDPNGSGSKSTNKKSAYKSRTVLDTEYINIGSTDQHTKVFRMVYRRLTYVDPNGSNGSEMKTDKQKNCV